MSWCAWKCTTVVPYHSWEQLSTGVRTLSLPLYRPIQIRWRYLDQATYMARESYCRSTFQWSALTKRTILRSPGWSRLPQSRCKGPTSRNDKFCLARCLIPWRWSGLSAMHRENFYMYNSPLSVRTTSAQGAPGSWRQTRRLRWW